MPLSSLIDGSTNGGMNGSDDRAISSSDFHWAHITGIGESTIADLALVTAAGFVQTHWDPAIVFMNQYAGYGKGHTIHPTAQIWAFGTQVHDSPEAKVASNASSLLKGITSLFPTALAFPT
jgi:hypothetical protein